MTYESKIRITSDTASATAGISKLKGSLNSLKTVANGIGAAFKASMLPLTALAGLAGGLGFGIKGVMDLGGELDDLSQNTGIAIRDLVILRKQFELAGIPAESLGTAVSVLSKRLDNPSANAAEWLNRFGITAQQISQMGLVERFTAIGDSIAKLGSATDRANAAQTFFGKSMGISLINLFRTSNGYETAEKYVGGLADTMDRIAPKMAVVGDNIESIKDKFLQFFAAFTERNLVPIQKVAEMIGSFDASQIGFDSGLIVNSLYNAFKDGKLWEALKSGFLYVLEHVKAVLLSILEFGAKHFAIAMQNAVSGTELGKKLGIESYDPNKVVTKNNGAAITPGLFSLPLSLLPPVKLPNYREWEERAGNPTFAEILAKNTDSAAINGYKNAFFFAGPPRAESMMTTLDDIETLKAEALGKILQSQLETLENYRAAFEAANPINPAIPFADILETANLFPVSQTRYARPALVDSLASVGGSSATTSGGMNSLLKIQRESLTYQKKIARNTENRTATFA